MGLLNMKKDMYNLTFPQENILFMERYNSGSAVNVISGLVNINKEFSVEKCNDAINSVIKKNDIMRARICENSGKFYQYIGEYEYEEFEVIDMSSMSKDEILEWIDGMVFQPLFSYDEKLYDFKILKYNLNSGSIFMKVNHIISDAWSCSKIGTQLVNVLENNLDDEEKPSYIEFINSENEYKNSEKFKKDSEFWKEYLHGVNDTVSLKEKNSNLSTKAQRYSVKLEKEINDKIINYCKENRISPYALFLAAVSTYIYRIKDKNDFVLGTPVLNRSNFKEKQMLGMFVSTLPLRVKIEEGEKFLDLTKKIGKDTLSVFRHQKYPYMKTLEYIRKNSDITSNLYNIVLSYQNARAELLDHEKYSTTWNFSKELQDDLQIHIMDMDSSGILNINYDYKVDLFDKIEIEYLHTRMLAIIENALNDLDVNVEDIRIMSKEEENKILYEFNDTKRDYPRDKTVIDLLIENVNKNPESIALIYEKERITYKELYERAYLIALQLKNVENENIIIMLDNSIELITSIYGVLMSGNCYVPINTSTPIDRIRSIAKDCNCKYAIMRMKLIDDVNYLDTKFVQIDKVKLINKSRPNKLAYMIYTSGSTGAPKGVKIANCSLINYIWWAKTSYTLDEKVIMPLYSSIAFDLTVTTIFLPIICGGTIIIYKSSGNEIIKIFKEDLVNIVKLTPAHLTLVNELGITIENIKTLILGGEALKSCDVQKIVNINPEIRIFNEYGPTEATVGCMIYKYSPDDKESVVSIGKPASNTNIYILDSKKRMNPIGVEGEMYIQGDCLSLGYNNLPEKNLESFFKIPFSDKIMYKSGDNGILAFDLNIKYIGRRDKQIKINGNRIELEEIENVASQLFDFKNVVVDVKYIYNNPNICLYYISENEYKPNYIMSKLRERLPNYMIPSRYVKVEYIPINKNGKVVRSELPVPKNANVVINKKINYKNELEKLVCDTWSEILCKNLIPEDNIFDFGVDSLSMIRCQVKLSQKINVIDIQKFYKYPVIREFCDNIYIESPKENFIEGLKNLENVKYGKNLIQSKKIKNVILLGGTGYLGVHILSELIKSKEIKKVFCIVRGIDYENRLRQKYEYFFGKNNVDKYNEKVVAINGIIEEEDFGLNLNQIKEITKDSSRIINAAAIVKHHGEYSKFEKVNVKTVKNIISICKKYDICLDHMSTISIASDGNGEVFDESKFFINQNYKINPYIETKFLAEKYILENFKDKNFQANIYRVGNLTWRYSDGLYQKNIFDNGFFMRIQNMISLKAYPESVKEMEIEMTPVDLAADFIVTLIKKSTEVNRIYHIYNPNQIKFIEIIEALELSNNKLRELPNDKFMKLLKAYDSKNNLLLNDIINSMGMLKSRIDNRSTISELKKFGKEWPILKYDYVKNICDYINISEERE